MAPSLLRGLLGLALTAAAQLQGGCAYFDWNGGRDALLARATAEGWTSRRIAAGQFTLLSLTRGAGSSDILTVYIEGDGLAWLDRTTPSRDPTPLRPVGLRLALEDGAPRILYLGRPCQYPDGSQGRTCDVRYWTSHRYAPEVVESLSAAITQAKTSSGAGAIELVGYSGGGVIAALVAARRSDVRRLITVAANLDLATWTRDLGVDPLTASLDPALEAERIAAIPQYHLVGRADDTVPPDVVRSYLARGEAARATRSMEIVPNFTHDCCWDRDWKRRVADIRTRLGASGRL